MKNRYYALKIAGICVFLFILQNIIPFINNNFILVSARVLQEPWMLITSIFLHGDIVHLLNNMFALALFGSILEHIIGSKKLLQLYFIGGVVASVSAVFMYNAALGASGAIFSLLGALVALRPTMTVWVSYFPMPMFLAGIVWAVIDLFRLFLPTGIASLAHLSGLAFGLAFGFYFRNNFKEDKSNKHRIVEHWHR
jgi:uncharacterized protein